MQDQKPEDPALKKNQIKEHILERWQSFDAAPEQYSWIWEGARWSELVFCLIARLGAPDLPLNTARELSIVLDTLGLSGVSTLAKIPASPAEEVFRHDDAAFMRELFQRAGASPSQAESIVITLVEAAQSVESGFQGMVQRYLRLYGERMLAEFDQHFTFSRMQSEDAQYAFTHWLQNVMSLPLPMSDPAVRRLCQEWGISQDELTEIADSMDLNLALLDDILAGESV